ncbi:hypothetical protein B0H15DRAFT_1025286 [Mycena belliarum]|uniref:Uncharacterized protein n=1 Tax=Mycena belliarum TaxID=1033014 RepID=A0AAD6XJX6_9AGAR|nr:hypothetical protein B0H15DRAFT_1025286 [Mycena belliae]
MDTATTCARSQPRPNSTLSLCASDAALSRRLHSAATQASHARRRPRSSAPPTPSERLSRRAEPNSDRVAGEGMPVQLHRCTTAGVAAVPPVTRSNGTTALRVATHDRAGCCRLRPADAQVVSCEQQRPCPTRFWKLARTGPARLDICAAVADGFCCSSPAAGLETSARVEHTSESPAGDAASEIAPAPICPPQTSARVRRARRPFSARGIRTPALGTSAGAVQGDSARSVAVRARENNARSRCGLRPPCSVCRSGGFSRATSASVPRLVAAAFPGPLPPDAAAACPRRPPYAVPSRQTRLPRPARPAAPIQKRAAPTSRRRIKAGARARACLLVTGPSVRGRAEWTARVPSRCERSLSPLRCPAPPSRRQLPPSTHRHRSRGPPRRGALSARGRCCRRR